MTIFVDARAGEIQIAGCTRVEGLEAWTGADLMVSRLTLPCKTKALLMKHIDEGAVLVQVKLGEDLPSSVGDRLVESIARMRECTRRIPQHMLLFVGVLGCDSEGSALINGHRTRLSLSYATVNTAIMDWMARGGMYYSIPNEAMLDAWARGFEANLNKYHTQAYRYALSTPDLPDDMPNPDEPLQIPVRVMDARRVLIGFRGLGPELVNRIWAYCGGFKESLAFLTDPQSVGKLEGIGPKTIASIRKQCGLTDSDSYIGWGHDAVDALIPQRFPELTPVRRSAEAIAKDTLDIFGKQRAK